MAHMQLRFASVRARNLAVHVLIIVVLFVLAGCGNGAGEDVIRASGFIEGEQVLVASEVGGRIVAMEVEVGDEVREGQVLVRLDDALLQAQRMEAVAAVTAAEANLARVRAGARPAERAAAQAALAEAEARRDGARRALENAQAALDNPQELDAQIAQARAQVALAAQAVEMARADLSETELLYNVYAGQSDDARRTWDLKLQAARSALAAAEDELTGARRYLNILYATRTAPLALQAELHAAEAAYAAAEAGVEAARAALDQIEAGPTPEEEALAQAQLRQAQAALALIDAQIAQLALTSPIDGLVISRSSHAGETAAPGIPLLTLANLDQVTLIVYIPVDQIGRVRIGQRAEVTVDSFPGRVFEGRVAAIATEAEFTPRNVQTREERVNLVFAVEVAIPNPDHALKLGMPADVVIRPVAGPGE